MTVNVHQAKTHLSRLLKRVAGGEEITIARAGQPVARLVAVEPKLGRRPLGLDVGLYKVPADFDAPLPAKVPAAFGEKGSRTKAGRAKSRRSAR